MRVSLHDIPDNRFSIRNPAYPLDIVDKLEESIMPNVESWMVKRAGQSNNCTLENAAVRREWYVKSESLAHKRWH
jgi:tyrosinase